MSVVVHLSDHNWVLVAQVDYHTNTRLPCFAQSSRIFPLVLICFSNAPFFPGGRVFTANHSVDESV